KPDRPRSWAAWAVGVAAILFGVLLCGWVIIKITHKDGSQTTLKVPPDTEVEIDKDGKVGVKLADGGKKPGKKDDTPKPGPDRGAPKATKGFVTSIDVSRDGKHLLFAATDGHVHWWDMVAGREALSFKFQDGWAALSPDGTKALTLDGQERFRLW